MNYCLGFLFDSFGEKVVLIRKTKPSWQAGLLNGLGGKVSKDEAANEAMVREFREEAGVATSIQDWKYFALMRGNKQNAESNFNVFCYFCFNTTFLEQAKTLTEEKVLVCTVKTLLREECLSNLIWLINLALDKDIRTQRLIPPCFEYA